MGTKAFKDFVKAVQAQIGTFHSTADLVETRIKTLKVRAQGEGEVAHHDCPLYADTLPTEANASRQKLPFRFLY